MLMVQSVDEQALRNGVWHVASNTAGNLEIVIDEVPLWFLCKYGSQRY